MCAASGGGLDGLHKPRKILVREGIVPILSSVSICCERVWGIYINEVITFCKEDRSLKIPANKAYAAKGVCKSCNLGRGGHLSHLRTDGHVELAGAVRSIDSVETVPVKVEEARRSVNRVHNLVTVSQSIVKPICFRHFGNSR